jgi:hypothetical protein
MELRAHNKLAEARFFVRALARSNGKFPLASHYASAATSALRSVTWVLKADLVRTHGERFDASWSIRRTVLSTSGIGFALLTEARNEATKTGAPLVRRVVRREFSDGQSRGLEFLIDPGFETLQNFRISLNSPMPKLGNPASEESARLFEERLTTLAPEFKTKVGLLREAWVEGSAPLQTVFGLKDELPFEVALAQTRTAELKLRRLQHDLKDSLLIGHQCPAPRSL